MVAEKVLDPVTLAVLRGRLEQIADEMDATLYRSAFNPIIAEAHDACHGLYDAQTGDTLIQGKSGLPVFVGAMAFAVRAAMRVAAERGTGMQDGDVWLFNDPYEGGTHANDFKLVRPCFRGGALYCFLASAAHWHDVGGAVPGNYNPAATECWQEAVQIPPVRILRANQLDEDVLAILRANTRLPDSLWGDQCPRTGERHPPRAHHGQERRDFVERSAAGNRRRQQQLRAAAIRYGWPPWRRRHDRCHRAGASAFPTGPARSEIKNHSRRGARTGDPSADRNARQPGACGQNARHHARHAAQTH